MWLTGDLIMISKDESNPKWLILEDKIEIDPLIIAKSLFLYFQEKKIDPVFFLLQILEK